MIVEPNSIQLNFLGGKATGEVRASGLLGLLSIQLLVSSELFSASFQTEERRIYSNIIHSVRPDYTLLGVRMAHLEVHRLSLSF